MAVGGGGSKNGAMARPLRSHWVPTRYGRRRHRTWILSMILASLGWGAWWAALFLAKFTALEVSVLWVEVVAALFGVPGLLVAVFTIRAQKAWLVFVSVPLFANLGLLLLPWVLPERVFG